MHSQLTLDPAWAGRGEAWRYYKFSKWVVLPVHSGTPSCWSSIHSRSSLYGTDHTGDRWPWCKCACCSRPCIRRSICWSIFIFFCPWRQPRRCSRDKSYFFPHLSPKCRCLDGPVVFSPSALPVGCDLKCISIKLIFLCFWAQRAAWSHWWSEKGINPDFPMPVGITIFWESLTSGLGHARSHNSCPISVFTIRIRPITYAFTQFWTGT